MSPVLILIWCVVFAVWAWLRPRSPLAPPVYPGAWPLIGHWHMCIGSFERMWNTEKKLYDYCLQKTEPIEIRLGPHSLYVITDPDDSLVILNKCLDKPYLYKFGKAVYGSGLVTADVSVWKPHRKLLNPAFSQISLNSYVEEYISQAKALVSLLALQVGKGPFDMTPYVTNSAVGTACRTVLGLKTDENREIVKNYADATTGLFVLYLERFKKIWLHIPLIFNLSSFKKTQDGMLNVLNGITETVITNRKSVLKINGDTCETPKEDSGKFRPLLDRMLDLAEQQDAFTQEEIRQHLDTIVAASYDSTSTAMMFTLILVGSHPDVQEKIYKELQEVLGHEDRDLNRHDLPKLVYLEAVVKESLRIFPPVPRVARTSSTSVQLKNHILPAYSSFVISVYGLNRHPSWGVDADLFKPERWLDPSSLPENPNAFATFSLGRRNCIGRMFGVMAVKTSMAHILRQYRVKSNIEKLVTKCDLIMKPVAGHEISLEARI